jgi:WhiB family transcriptional regulator, redox-sensing transcriptional regulator
MTPAERLSSRPVKTDEQVTAVPRIAAGISGCASTSTRCTTAGKRPSISATASRPSSTSASASTTSSPQDQHMSTELDSRAPDGPLGLLCEPYPEHQEAPVGAHPRLGQHWRSRAACRFTDPDLFFPISDSGRGLEQRREAKEICLGCVVWSECLEFAIGTRQVHGIWGGMTEQERRDAERTAWRYGATDSGGAARYWKPRST